MIERPICNLCREAASSTASDGDVALMASMGALALGHTLLCPTVHARSVAALPPSTAERLLGMVPNLAARLSEHTGHPVHAFEHGNACDGARVACSVEHAHLHLLPVGAEVTRELDAQGSWQLLEWNAQALRELTGGREYLLYRAPGGAARVWITDGQPIPSQLMRQVMARALRRAEAWNWREHPAAERTGQTRELLGRLTEIGQPILSA